MGTYEERLQLQETIKAIVNMSLENDGDSGEINLTKLAKFLSKETGIKSNRIKLEFVILYQDNSLGGYYDAIKGVWYAKKP